MKTRSAWRCLLPLGLCLALLAPFLLPCLCAGPGSMGRVGHCARPRGEGAPAALAACCCDSLPVAFDLTAKVLPQSPPAVMGVATESTHAFSILPPSTHPLGGRASPAHPPATILRI